MKIKYFLDGLEQNTIESFVKALREAQIPFLADGREILINREDQDIFDSLLSQVLKPEKTSPTSAAVSPQNIDQVMAETIAIREKQTQQYVNQIVNDIIHKNDAAPIDDEGSFAFQLLGALVGGGFGIAIVVAALNDPNYEGRIPLFLPAIIFGVVGFFIGAAIDSAIDRSKGR